MFLVAGFYNLAWGIYSVADPQWLFRLARMRLQNTPEIFAALGMVVGLYGIVYLEIARRPERGWIPAAVALIGKVFGAAGLAYLILAEGWPKESVVLTVTNDLIWLLPFGLYLHDAWPIFRTDAVTLLEGGR